MDRSTAATRKTKHKTVTRINCGKTGTTATPIFHEKKKDNKDSVSLTIMGHRWA
jgi:hypothetical protein